MRKLKLEELNRMDQDEFRDSKKIPLVIILDNIRSQHNIGSVFRTADAFRVKMICLCGITATPPHREIHKTALGATDSVSWKYFESSHEAVADLKTQGYRVIAIEQTDTSIPINEVKLNWQEKYAIVLGNEVKGVQQEIIEYADLTVEIPQFGTKHSLNVSVCNGIVVWEFFKQLRQAIK